MKSSKKPRVLIYTAMNKRHLVSELFCMGIKRIEKAHPGITFYKHAVISEDPSEALCNRFGFSTTRSPNNPLGKKWNSGLEAALALYEFDYVLIMGDDDLMDSRLLDEFKKPMSDGEHHFGVNELYFYSPQKNQATHFQYDFNADKLVGCGRMISREAIERTGWQMMIKARRELSYLSMALMPETTAVIPHYQAQYLKGMRYADCIGHVEFKLWDDDLPNGLDNCSEMNLLVNGYQPLRIKTPTPMVIDVKTSMNIWSYDRYKPLGKSVPVKEALSIMSNDEKEFMFDNLS